MSRRSRRAAVIRSGVPEVIGRPFDDVDLPEAPEGVSPPEGVSTYPDSIVPPLSDRPLSVYLESSPGVWGRMPHAKPSSRRPLPVVVGGKLWFRRKVPFNAKPAFGDYASYVVRKRAERRRLVFNTLAVPFSRRARFCVKRKVKRMMIFATKKSGRNGAKVYRRNYESAYKC